LAGRARDPLAKYQARSLRGMGRTSPVTKAIFPSSDLSLRASFAQRQASTSATWVWIAISSVGVVRVSLHAPAVERGVVVIAQRRLEPQAKRQMRIADKEFSECHSVEEQVFRQPPQRNG